MRGLANLIRVVRESHLDPCCPGKPLGLARTDESPGPQDRGARMVAIEAIRLSKVLGGRRVLRELDLQIAEGQTVALTGANGAGKTTLLRCLASVSRPTAGEVRWFGNSATVGAAARRLIGLAAHESFLYPHLTVRENLLFVARMYDVPEPAARTEELIRRVGLGPHADRWSSALSRGMRQRLAVVRALVHDPPIVLLDEPFAGLDEAATVWLTELLSDLRARRRTVCFSTHDPRTARTLAHRVLQLRSGRIDPCEEGPGATRAEVLPMARAA
jgi:heme exporter protein A